LAIAQAERLKLAGFSMFFTSIVDMKNCHLHIAS